MREIKFRGKRIDNIKRERKEFVYGSYLYLNTYGYDWKGDRDKNKEEVHFIIGEDDINIVIDKETLGQYTGLKDKNGKKIYEGDIVLFEDTEMSTENGYGDNFINKGVIEYNEENCCFNVTERITAVLEDVLYKNNESLEIIGNIYDNPELLKEE